MFALTNRTGPVSIPRGYVGNLYSTAQFDNSEAISALPLFPYYRAKNASPKYTAKYCRFRTNAAFGMKPVNFSFVPTYLRHTSLNAHYVPAPSDPFPKKRASYTNPAVGGRIVRRPAPYIPFINYEEDDWVDTYPSAATVLYDQHSLIDVPLYGVDVCTRPGSWTTGNFPGLTVYTRLTIRFYKRKQRPNPDGSALHDSGLDLRQMAWGKPMFGL